MVDFTFRQIIDNCFEMHFAMIFVYVHLITEGGFTKILWTNNPKHQLWNHVLNLENEIEIYQDSGTGNMNNKIHIKIHERKAGFFLSRNMFGY